MLANVVMAKDNPYRKIDATKLPAVADLNVISDSLISSGLPNPEHFKGFAEAGVEAVVSVLSPNDKLQTDLCAIQEAGLIFTSVPYNTVNPVASIEAFRATMDMLKGKRIIVFCRRNFRSSTMVYMWNRLVTGEDDHNFIKGKVSMDSLIMTVEPKNRHKLYDFIKPLEKHYGIKVLK